MSVRKKIGLFWDIENVKIPVTKSTSGVAMMLKNYFHEQGDVIKFVVACNTEKVDKHNLDKLKRFGATIAYVSGTSKNSADFELIEQIDMFIDQYKQYAMIVIISSDRDFILSINSARRKGVHVALIYGENCSPEFKVLVKDSYLFKDLIQDVESITANEKVYLIVTSVPQNKTIKDVKDQLSEFATKHRGTIWIVSDGQALINICCKVHAISCRKEMRGKKCFDSIINVNIIEGSKAPEKCKLLINDLANNEAANKQVPRANNSKDNNIKPSEQCEGQSNSKTAVIPNMFVIKGFKTNSDENFTKTIKEIVMNWRDNSVDPESIVEVTRDNNVKNIGKKGKFNLYVKTTCAEASVALRTAAEKHFDTNSGITWIPYRKYCPDPIKSSIDTKEKQNN